MMANTRGEPQSVEKLVQYLQMQNMADNAPVPTKEKTSKMLILGKISVSNDQYDLRLILNIFTIMNNYNFSD